MPNRLNEETSPYLLQHADNPVHWQAWGETALEAARSADKPILLSVGYSACHWCHVMAHESFEDEATAKLMNDLFVNVKVDREERPDIDKIYQTAHQLYTGRAGGWPLTVFLTPDSHLPIFTGTYFPRERRYGMPAFREVLVAIDKYYRTQGAEIRERGAGLVEAFDELATGSADDFADLSRAPLEQARERLGRSYDNDYGGFGDAPKFPHAPNLELLLAHWQRSAAPADARGGAAAAGDARGSTPARTTGARDDAALAMVTHTLDRMALGGLYDQLGGGFYRYSVDRHWSIPHFEKMLYDNAALLSVYADAFTATGEPLYRRVASATADWVIRDMQDARGAFYSTLDADSEHEEGKFYVWTPAELDALLTADESRLAKRVFGLTRAATPTGGAPNSGAAANASGAADSGAAAIGGGADEVTAPNFEDHFWHLQVAVAPDAAAAALGIGAERGAALLESARAKLLAARGQRVWPGRDEKVLVSWNGLMIAGLARAARALARPDLAEAATRAVDFIRAELWSGGRLKATYKDGRARFAAYLDDYAFLANGLVELLQCRWRGSDLDFACELIDTLLAHFEDERGGFYFTADDHEALIHKPKTFADEAVPSGNGIAAGVLVRLGHLLGEQRYLDAAERIVRAGLHAIGRYPEGHATLLHALDELLAPPTLVVVRAPAAHLDAWRSALTAHTVRTAGASHAPDAPNAPDAPDGPRQRGVPTGESGAPAGESARGPTPYHPHRLAFFLPADAGGLRGLLAERRAPASGGAAYVCEGMTCRAPIDTPAELASTLGSS
jgi:uncharacterized protein YyaL (SSP411 family)